MKAATNAQILMDRECRDYIKAIYPDATPAQAVELRRTFYAGAYITLGAVAKGGSLRDFHEAAFQECCRFYEMAQKDMEQDSGRKTH